MTAPAPRSAATKSPRPTLSRLRRALIALPVVAALVLSSVGVGLVTAAPASAGVISYFGLSVAGPRLMYVRIEPGALADYGSFTASLYGRQDAGAWQFLGYVREESATVPLPTGGNWEFRLDQTVDPTVGATYSDSQIYNFYVENWQATAVATSSTTARLSFPAGMTNRYYVYRAGYAPGWVTTSNSTVDITGLSPNTTYNVNAGYIASGGNPVFSLPSFTTPQAPPASATTLFGASNNRSVDLSWTSVAGVGVVYDVYRREGSGSWMNVVYGLDGLTTSVTGLTNRTAYDFKAVARNGGGSAPDSNILSVTPLQKLSNAPEAELTVSAPAELNLNWKAPTGGTTQPTDVVINYTAADGVPRSLVQPIASGSAIEPWSGQTVLRSLPLGPLSLSIAARNATGDSPATALTTRVLGLPAAPVLVPSPTDHGFRLTPDLLSSDNNPSAITGVLVEVQHNGEDWVSQATTVVANDLIVEGLIPGDTYAFRAHGVNAVGAGAVGPATAQVGALQLSVPVVMEWAKSGNRQITIGASYEQPVGAAFDAVQWQIATVDAAGAVGTFADVPFSLDNSDTLPVWTFAGLDNGQHYQLRARTTGALGASAWALADVVRPVAGPPAAADILSLAQIDGGLSVAVDWNSTSENPSDAVDATWFVASEYSNDWQQVSATEVDGAIQLSGLNPGSVYRVRVLPANEAGEGPSTDFGSMLVIAPPLPVDFDSSTVGDGTVTITGTTPTSTGRPLLSVEWRTATFTNGVLGAWTAVAPTESTVDGVHTWNYDGLEDGVDVVYQARGMNTVGSSDWTTTPTLRPIAGPAEPLITGVEQVPLGLRVGVDWSSTDSNPSSGADAHFQVRGEATDEEWTDVAAVADGAGWTINGLVRYAEYQVRVKAENTTAESSFSGESSFVQVIALPDPLALFLGSPMDGGVVIHSFTDDQTTATTVYEFAVVTDGEAGAWQIASTIGEPDSSAGMIVDSLTNGVDYLVRVQRTNAVGTSVWQLTDVVRPIAAPAAPTVTEVTAADGALLVAADVADTADRPAQSFDLRVIIDDGGPIAAAPIPNSAGWSDVDTGKIGNGHWTAVTATRSGDVWRIPGLENGTRYRVALSSFNTSGWAGPAESTVSVAPVAAPVAPTFITVATGDGFVETTLKAPDAARLPDSYEWRVSSVTGPNAGQWASVSATLLPDNTFRLGPLTNGESYLLGVRAANVSGVSPWAGFTGVLTPAVGPVTPVPPRVPVSDVDTDGDGIPNEFDPDVDGDGIPNANDPDVDGDGIDNVFDPDVDGDTVQNNVDPDADADGILNGADETPNGIGTLIDIDGDGIPNGVDTDIDGDGLDNAVDPDVDGDGIPNGQDSDVDGDGIPNGIDPDVDGDGIPNGQDSDVDGDGIANGDDRDVDGDGIPNGLDPDIDGDGIVNGSDPDMDGDGIPNATDPDADGDGVDDAVQTTPIGGGGTAGDIDGDGIPNEFDPDVDGDGIANVFDPDVDGDGIPNGSDPDIDGDGVPNDDDATPNGIGTLTDIDGDGIPNGSDSDVDGDGLPKGLDPDVDGDGIPNGLDPDVDGDGIPNGSDPDVDGDGIPNGSDPDVDGDGIPNVYDPDVDGDGIPNGVDPDIDGDGIPNGDDATPNGIGTLTDIDGDGIPNAIDPDVDGDGIDNVFDPDVDGDGYPNVLDPDADGDGVPNTLDATPNGIGTPADIDGDGIPNGSDSDVDGDGLPNGVDPDVDGDGIPNGVDPDVDGDGLPNVFDPDVDGDGIPNGVDPDIDGDGIPNGDDATPNGIGTLTDIDGDGIPNAIDPDVDGDGIDNVFDPDVDGDGIPNGSDPDIDGDGVLNNDDATPNGIGTLTDIDGDGIPNEQDADIDGDGILNPNDPDMDGDGVPNALDPDIDGDDIPNGSDSTPGGYIPPRGGSAGGGNTGSGTTVGGGSASVATGDGAGIQAWTDSRLLAVGHGKSFGRGASGEASDSDRSSVSTYPDWTRPSTLLTFGLSLLALLFLLAAGFWWYRERRKRQTHLRLG